MCVCLSVCLYDVCATCNAMQCMLQCAVRKGGMASLHCRPQKCQQRAFRVSNKIVGKVKTRVGSTGLNIQYVIADVLPLLLLFAHGSMCHGGALTNP